MSGFDDEEDFYSVMKYYADDDYGDTIPLRESINIQDLVRKDGGAEFEVDPSNAQYGEEGLPEYHHEDVHKYLNTDALGLVDDESQEDDNPENDDGPFENLAKTMENLTEDGGVKKKILVQGVGSVVPMGMQITCHYSGSLEYSDEPYDSTRLRARPLRYHLGCGEMIEGLELGLSTMKRREEAEFLISPEYAFGARGVPPRIPKDATLLFQVELLDWMEASEIQKYFRMPREERRSCDIALLKKVAHFFLDEGKSSHKQERYVGATKHFTKGIRAVEDYRPADAEVEKEFQRLMLKLCQNACISHMKLCNYNTAKRYADQALQIDPKALKVLYHLGKAQRMCGDFDQATRTLREALRIAPKNKAITEELKEINRYKAAMDFNHVDMCRRMFKNPRSDQGNDSKKVNADTTSTDSQVTEGFTKSVDSRLKAFAAGDVMELSLPLQKFTISEKNCIEKLCTDKDLEYIEKGEGSNLHIKICKKRPRPN